MSPELFVALKALMGFGLPLAFCLQQLRSLKRLERERAGGSPERPETSRPAARSGPALSDRTSGSRRRAATPLRAAG